MEKVFYPGTPDFLTGGMNQTGFSNEEIHDSISRACKFFELPEAPIVSGSGTCVWINDPNDLTDDVFGFSSSELNKLGITTEDSLTLAYTHECAHRALQQNDDLNQWERELACDFYAGLNAGLNHIDLSEFEAAIGETGGDETHPNGALRALFMEKGIELANEMSGDEITFESSFELFQDYLDEKSSQIEAYQHRDIPTDGQSANTSGDGAEHLGINDSAWHYKQAEQAASRAEYEANEARKAGERKDFSAAKEHAKLSEEYSHKASDERQSASSCTH